MLKINFDLWHKTHKFYKSYKLLVTQKVKKFDREYKFPGLYKNFIEGKLDTRKLKRRWNYCSENCEGDRVFLRFFLSNKN